MKRLLALFIILCILLSGCGQQSNVPPSVEPTASIGTEDITAPVESDEVTKPAESEEPSAPVESDEVTEPAESEEPSDPVESDEVTEPAESEEPSDPVESDEVTEPAESEEPSAPVESDEVTEPAESEEPSAPVESDEVTESAESEEPADPIETDPVTEPSQTDAPTDDLSPDEPVVLGCGGHDTDPYEGVDKAAFYADYAPACCYIDACYRTEHFLLSGMLTVPGQYATISEYQPVDENGLLIRNTDYYYLDDGNTYVVVDAYGCEVLRLYKGAAYITLEEIAAYMYAFGGSNDTLPANYSSKKVTRVGTNPWGAYLRSNHSYFSGDTRRYPYEPVLPDISGCGGSLQYYELDIGTTGTDTGNGYAVKIYNDGTSITRGAARLVYTRMDKNRNGIYETDEVYVFYTANHYNDFREYLNYYNGWGEIFGNETGGGTLSSKTYYNPTPYVPTAYFSFSELYT